MAASAASGANLPKPRRTLLLFLAAVVGLYGLIAS